MKASIGYDATTNTLTVTLTEMDWRVARAGSFYQGELTVQEILNVTGQELTTDLLRQHEVTDERRVTSRQVLLRSVNHRLERLADDRRLADLGSYQQRAISLLTSEATRHAFDIQREPDRLRERYGRHKYGQSLLLARRLVRGECGGLEPRRCNCSSPQSL